mmetsp:Transcript_17585/g.39771  ORF Transcript_17585/g.39771 Transcript_17585/m.39771 type:complete len:224 (+) Transcript_17585:1134-1805(+)
MRLTGKGGIRPPPHRRHHLRREGPGARRGNRHVQGATRVPRGGHESDTELAPGWRQRGHAREGAGGFESPSRRRGLVGSGPQTHDGGNGAGEGAEDAEAGDGREGGEGDLPVNHEDVGAEVFFQAQVSGHVGQRGGGVSAAGQGGFVQVQVEEGEKGGGDVRFHSALKIYDTGSRSGTEDDLGAQDSHVRGPPFRHLIHGLDQHPSDLLLHRGSHGVRGTVHG